MSLEAGERVRIEAARAAGAADAGVAEAVVGRALVAVGEHRVGLGRLLELLLGRRVARDCDRDGTSARACGTRS